jgi:hypothetical protein
MREPEISKKQFALRSFIILGIPVILTTVFYLSMQYGGVFEKIVGEGTKLFKFFRGQGDAKSCLCWLVFLVLVAVAVLIVIAVEHLKDKKSSRERRNDKVNCSVLPGSPVTLIGPGLPQYF